MRTILILVGAGAVGCANDPTYVQCPPGNAIPECVASLETGFTVDDGMGNQVPAGDAKSRLLLPINIESTDDAAARAMRTAALGIDVPYVKLGDIEIAVEWTIKNLDTMNEGLAFVELDGATEFFEYDPDTIVVSDDEEAPPTPGLEGNIPLHIPAGGTLSGLFREDQLREAAIDCEQVTRANVNPFAAILTINKNDSQIQPLTPYDPADPDVVQMPAGPPIPREAFANLVRIDLVFSADTHMVLEYAVRVRDVRGGMLAEDLYDAPANELQMFNIMPFGTAP
jgi:hypothetical protein